MVRLRQILLYFTIRKNLTKRDIFQENLPIDKISVTSFQKRNRFFTHTLITQ
jgi:hypothetical protein